MLCWISPAACVSAFYSYEADEQMLELRQTIVQALDASFGSSAPAS